VYYVTSPTNNRQICDFRKIFLLTNIRVVYYEKKMIKGVFASTFSVTGAVVALSLGTVCGGVRNALRPAPKRWTTSSPYDMEDDGYEYQMRDDEWVMEGMMWGGATGLVLTATWPVLLFGGLPVYAIYKGCRAIQNVKSLRKQEN